MRPCARTTAFRSQAITPTVEPAIEDQARAAICRGADRDAITILVRAFGPLVLRYCRAILHDTADAEDLLQITFLHAQRGLASAATHPSLKAWLLVIARHRCFDLLRARRRRPRVDAGASADAVMRLPAQEAGVSAELAARWLGAELEACLDALDPRARAAVVMRFRDQLSYDEIAAATGEKVVTLRVRVSRALPILRRCLEAKGVEL